ncbi:MAG: glycosyltransferase family 4 protein [Ignavibacteria bacterium]|nr:glycosyltransferase family 4 protein [Ignavibacteria bacterium]
MEKKLKVVWICHFSNNDVRARLPLSQMKLKNRIKSLLGRKTQNQYFDFAPWITNLIREFENFKDIELHVVAPIKGLKQFTSEFEMRGIFYHFFKVRHTSVPNKFYLGIKTKFLLNRYFVKKFINGIKPDIVNLIGTENPYYSITTLDIKNTPVYVSAQTVYTNPDRKKYSDSCIKLFWDVEMSIHKKEKYFGCHGRMHRDLLLNNNPNAIIFKMFFPMEKPQQVKQVLKIYDFVFFGGIVKKKGIEDLIEALAIVKNEKSNVTLNIVGKCPESYMNFLLNKINELDLSNNIVFTDYFPVHSDMHQHIVQSHFAVLPLKLDVIASSVIEAIFLGLPLVTYKTSGTPYLNKNGESVLLANIGDIEMLAKQMLKLLNSPTLAKQLSKNARSFVEKEFDNTNSAKRLVSNYRAVVEHYNNNTPIPEEQLFNISEFPIY